MQGIWIVFAFSPFSAFQVQLLEIPQLFVSTFLTHHVLAGFEMTSCQDRALDLMDGSRGTLCIAHGPRAAIASKGSVHFAIATEAERGGELLGTNWNMNSWYPCGFHSFLVKVNREDKILKIKSGNNTWAQKSFILLTLKQFSWCRCYLRITLYL